MSLVFHNDNVKLNVFKAEDPSPQFCVFVRL